MNKIQQISFKIITQAGIAKSSYMQAISQAKKGEFDAAFNSIKEGEDAFVIGHQAHFELIQQEANGDDVIFSFLLMHAEDQMMSCDNLKILALEIIDLRKEIKLNINPNT